MGASSANNSISMSPSLVSIITWGLLAQAKVLAKRSAKGVSKRFMWLPMNGCYGDESNTAASSGCVVVLRRRAILLFRYRRLLWVHLGGTGVCQWAHF